MPQHSISLPDAVAMAKRFRMNREKILSEKFQKQDILPFSETFDATAIERVLSQPGCESLRIYFGMNEAMQVHVILVGADREGNDILPVTGRLEQSSNGNEGEGEGEILEDSKRCPLDCPPSSPLNSDE